LLLKRQQTAHGIAVTKSIAYNLKRREPLDQFIAYDALPLENFNLENRI